MNKQQQITNNHAALYCRLSVDDGNLGGSVSIETQQLLLTQYCVKSGISEYEVYADDGYSGTNFERPAFKKMLADIRNGEISMVIVKDQSRFGRNYIEVGMYVEMFKDEKVRFIAIHDNYDLILSISLDTFPPNFSNPGFYAAKAALQ